MQKQEGKTALYCRFSKDDGMSEDSCSIVNQKRLLEQYAFENGYHDYEIFVDDGYTGVNFQRRDFLKMIAKIESGEIKRIIVKDMSRLGRNAAMVGQFVEYFLPQYNVQLISVDENIDTFKKDSTEDLMYFRNWFNEQYAKDISKKARAAINAKGKAGKRLSTHAIYGYKKDPSNKENWIIDEEAAKIVRRIFEMFNNGYGISMIARELHDEQVLTPAAYKGKIRHGTFAESDPYQWSGTTITSILTKQEYCGDTVNFRTERKSFKDKRIIHHSEDEIMIFTNTQPAIISRDVFVRTKKKLERRQKIRKEYEPAFFADILFCYDCKGRMYIQRRTAKKGNGNAYQCSNCRKRLISCTTHYVKESVLLKMVFRAIQKVINENLSDTKAFRKKLRQQVRNKMDSRMKIGKVKMDEIAKELSAIKTMCTSAYEDKVNGEIDTETFQQLMSAFSERRSLLEAEYAELEQLEKVYHQSMDNVEVFIRHIGKYTEPVTVLERDVMLDLVERIEVHEKDENGMNQIDIFFRYIGRIE